MYHLLPLLSCIIYREAGESGSDNEKHVLNCIGGWSTSPSVCEGSVRKICWRTQGGDHLERRNFFRYFQEIRKKNTAMHVSKGYKCTYMTEHIIYRDRERRKSNFWVSVGMLNHIALVFHILLALIWVLNISMLFFVFICSLSIHRFYSFI